MRDGEDGAARELPADGALDGRVGLQVDGGGRLVEHQNLRATDCCSRQTEQLPLTDRQVRTARLQNVLQTASAACRPSLPFSLCRPLSAAAREEVLQLSHFQELPELLVGVLIEGIQIEPHSPY